MLCNLAARKREFYNAFDLYVLTGTSIRGIAECPAYNASKAYISNYVEGIRCKVKKQKLNIIITDIKPGLVDTAMAKGGGLFWVMPLEKATTQIYTALKHRKDEVYVTKRWGFMGFLLKRMPKSLYWHLDVTFCEDANQTLEKRAAFNLNIINKIALSVLKIFDLRMKPMSFKKKHYSISIIGIRQFEW